MKYQNSNIKKLNIFLSIFLDIFIKLKNKVVLTSHDDKRFIIYDKYRTAVWCHKSVESFKSILDTNNDNDLNEVLNLLG